MLKNVNIDLILKPVAVQKCVLSELSQSNKEWQLTWEPKQMFKEKLNIKKFSLKDTECFHESYQVESEYSFNLYLQYTQNKYVYVFLNTRILSK